MLHDPRAGRLQLYGAGPSVSSSPPVLLVHSVNAAASAYEVRPVYERLAVTRPTYAIDLPGFGLSDRSPRRYVPRLMTDAIHAAVEHVRHLHPGTPIDALAVSLSCEFLARAAGESASSFRTLALVSPTGLTGRRMAGPSETTLGRDGVQAALARRWLGPRLFGWLTRPGVVRYFLQRTYGRKAIDEGLWAYAVATAHQPGAEHAPLYFLSGHLFSRDATLLYERPLARADYACLALVVGVDVPTAQVAGAIRKYAGADLEALELFDVYEGAQVGAGKRSLAYRLTFRAANRTLSDADVNKVRAKIVRGLEYDVKAAIRG